MILPLRLHSMQSFLVCSALPNRPCLPARKWLSPAATKCKWLVANFCTVLGALPSWNSNSSWWWADKVQIVNKIMRSNITLRNLPSCIREYSRIKCNRQFARIGLGIFERFFKVLHVTCQFRFRKKKTTKVISFLCFSLEFYELTVSHPDNSNNNDDYQSSDFSKHENILQFCCEFYIVAIDECQETCGNYLKNKIQIWTDSVETLMSWFIFLQEYVTYKSLRPPKVVQLQLEQYNRHRKMAVAHNWQKWDP